MSEWHCSRCGLTLKNKPPEPIRCKCSSIACRGPGYHLSAIIPSLLQSAGCNCKAYALQMDRWGVDGCEARFDEIVDYLCNQSDKIKLLPSANPLNRFVARRWLKKAIERARSQR